MDDGSAVLIIRVWTEDGMDSFRGRLTTVPAGPEDGGADDEPSTVVSSPGDVLTAVGEWLGTFERRTTDRH